MRRIQVGDAVYIGNRSECVDDDGNPVDAFEVDGVATEPTTVALLVIDGAGATTVYHWPTGTPALLRESAGRFFIARAPTEKEEGVWRFRLVGNGAVTEIMEGSFSVIAASPAADIDAEEDSLYELAAGPAARVRPADASSRPLRELVLVLLGGLVLGGFIAMLLLLTIGSPAPEMKVGEWMTPDEVLSLFGWLVPLVVVACMIGAVALWEWWWSA
jgi:hypothetical protein